MRLILTPEVLRTSYDYLKSTKPFNKWKLPLSDLVEMRVMRYRSLIGQWEYSAKHHIIGFNEKFIGTTDSLMRAMAHEMIHIAQYELKAQTNNTEHNKDFYKKIKQVASYHGFDSKWF